VQGRLPNTAAKSWDAGAGLAYIGSNGSIGVAYSHTDSLYGVPIRYATLAKGRKPAHPAQPGPLGCARRNPARQRRDREDSARFGYAAYRHAELAPDGSVGTTSSTTAWRAGWK
jgi:iron complex outermembrane receptor protein